MSLNQSIASAVSTGKCKVGVKSSLDALRTDEAKLVIIAANCPQDEREDLERFAQLGNVRVRIFEGTSWDLGETVGKPFMVSAIAVLEPGDSKILKMD